MNVFDVVGFGALNVDKLFSVNRISAAEEESFVTDYNEACGGSAANTVVGLARLRCRVGFIGKVANDREGRLLLKDFRAEGVDTKGIVRANNGRSGTALGFVDRDGQRALYIDPGVNDTIGVDEVDGKYMSHARFLHLTSFVGEKSFQTQRQLVSSLSEKVRIGFDPGALYVRRGLPALIDIISKSFALLPNSGELELLTAKSDYRKGAETLLKKGVRVVAVKLGSRGCYVTDGKQSHHVEAFKVKVVDTTGAGDAFNAGFLYGLLHDKSLYECGRIGNFVASRCVTKIGARPGLPHIDDLASLR